MTLSQKKVCNRVQSAVFVTEVSNLLDYMTAWVPLACISRIFFYICNLGSGQCSDLSIISQWRKMKMLLYPCVRIGAVQIFWRWRKPCGEGRGADLALDKYRPDLYNRSGMHGRDCYHLDAQLDLAYLDIGWSPGEPAYRRLKVGGPATDRTPDYRRNSCPPVKLGLSPVHQFTGRDSAERKPLCYGVENIWLMRVSDSGAGRTGVNSHSCQQSRFLGHAVERTLFDLEGSLFHAS